MKDFIFLSLFIFASLTSVRSSFRNALDGLLSGMSSSLTEDLQKHLDVVKDKNAPKGIQNILEKKGEEVKKLEEVFSKTCDEGLKDVNDSVKARMKEQMVEVHEVFDENYDQFRDIAAAEHYREVKPFYDFVCAFRLMDDILEDVWHKTEYGGIMRAKDLMIKMKKTDTPMKSNMVQSAMLSPPHVQFADYVVPGENRLNVDRAYNKWRLYVLYELNRLATSIRSELELVRGERMIEDVIIEFAYTMAKMGPYAKFVYQEVIPQVRRSAEEDYEKQTVVTPFLDKLPRLMPQKKWYFPRQYLDYFSVLLRALGKRAFKALEYYRDDVKTLLPGSEECFGDTHYEDIYTYISMYFSTPPTFSISNSTDAPHE